jgi:hypothetical protein
MNADARSKINATRMRSPLHALCLRGEEVVNRYFPVGYAVIPPGDIDFSFPPLGCAHSIPGKNSEAVPVSHRRQTLDVSSLAFLLSSFPKGLRPENPEIIDEHIHFGKTAACLVVFNQMSRVHGHAAFDSNSRGLSALSRSRRYV